MHVDVHVLLQVTRSSPRDVQQETLLCSVCEGEHARHGLTGA